MPRYTVEFSEQADKGLEQVQKTLGATSKADVIRKALNLLNYVVQEKERGGTLYIENKKENVKKEIVTI